MAKKVTRKNSRLADDIRESLCEAGDYFREKRRRQSFIVSVQRRPMHTKRG
jgi:hypothetical protein